MDSVVNAGPIACLLIPDAALRLETLRRPAWDGLPLVLADPTTSHARRVTGVTPEASELGVRVGMPVREALSLAPQVVVITPDLVHYARAFRDLTQRLSAVTPRLSAEELGCIYLDLRGLGRHYASLGEAGRAILEAVNPALRPRLGLGDSRFTAYVAARRARPAGICRIAPDKAAAALARMPVDVLPVPEETKQRLRHLGLARLGAIARLSSGAMQAQFGPPGRQIWELAHGRDTTPFVSAPFVEPLVEQVILPAPTALSTVLLSGIHQLVSRLLARPELRNAAIRKLVLQLRIEGDRSVERTIIFKACPDRSGGSGSQDQWRLVAVLNDHLQRRRKEWRAACRTRRTGRRPARPAAQNPCAGRNPRASMRPSSQGRVRPCR